MAQVANPQLKPLSAAEPMCPEALSDIVMKALSPDPTLRFQNAEEFRSKLQAILLELDPNAGPETSSRFMRDCFATEYQAERKMLTALKEQAKQVFAGAQDPDNEVTAEPPR